MNRQQQKKLGVIRNGLSSSRFEHELETQKWNHGKSQKYNNEVPTGSLFLNTKGEIVGIGEESHKDQIVRAYKTIQGKEPDYRDEFQLIDDTMEHEGIVRIKPYKETLDIDSVNPLNAQQRKRLKDLVIERNYSPDKITISGKHIGNPEVVKRGIL